jgi:RNA recognition motif-containing protein
MGARLFVGSLAWSTTDDALHALFAPYGELEEAVVIRERNSERSRGFGYVSYVDAKDAESATMGLHDTELDGRKIRVIAAEERRTRRRD